jgi:hypothetical protein
MNSITFAMPTLATSAMSVTDQLVVTANQAAAAIVCCYLEHCNAAINKGIPGAAGTRDTAFLTQSELGSPSYRFAGVRICRMMISTFDARNWTRKLLSAPFRCLGTSCFR